MRLLNLKHIGLPWQPQTARVVAGSTGLCRIPVDNIQQKDIYHANCMIVDLHQLSF
jgi:hypothetical protein